MTEQEMEDLDDLERIRRRDRRNKFCSLTAPQIQQHIKHVEAIIDAHPGDAERAFAALDWLLVAKPRECAL